MSVGTSLEKEWRVPSTSRHGLINGASLVHLKELKNLSLLDLNNTNISDAGLTHLKELKDKGSLNLKNTKITKEGSIALKKALPKYKIISDF